MPSLKRQVNIKKIFNTGSKYGSQKIQEDGFTFGSKIEHEYYQLLKLQQRAGLIKHIDVHPTVTLSGGIRWKLDFMVYHGIVNNGKIELIDVKGFETEGFRIKRKLFDAAHPLAPLIVVKKKGGKFVC